MTQTVPIKFRTPADAKRWTPTPEVVEAMIRRVVDQFGPRIVILFGSVARDEVRRDSDVDLLIAFDDVPDEGHAILEIRRALREFFVPKDVVVATTSEVTRRDHGAGSFLRPALREGIVVYDRGR